MKYRNNQEIYDRLKDYYTLLPNTISNDLVNWAIENKKNRSDKQYLNTIINTFADGSYFYNLSPKILSGNSYADFFFNSKEGYCEYFAGTFVLLARLGGIPIELFLVTWWRFKRYCDFYVFRQQDACLGEVWFEKEGWVRVDQLNIFPKKCQKYFK